MYQAQHQTKDGSVLYGRDVDGALFVTIQHKDGREHGYDQRIDMAYFDHSMVNEEREMVYTKRAVINLHKYHTLLYRLGIEF